MAAAIRKHRGKFSTERTLATLNTDERLKEEEVEVLEARDNKTLHIG